MKKFCMVDEEGRRSTHTLQELSHLLSSADLLQIANLKVGEFFTLSTMKFTPIEEDAV